MKYFIILELLRLQKAFKVIWSNLIQSTPITVHVAQQNAPTGHQDRTVKPSLSSPGRYAQSFTDQYVLSSNMDSISNRLKNKNTSEDLESKHLNILKKKQSKTIYLVIQSIKCCV